jgi:hypothetical protein
MAGSSPAIHVFLRRRQDVDARHKAGHDVVEYFVIAGLDPAIHGAAPNIRPASMDRRVKPGGDDIRAVAWTERSAIRECREASMPPRISLRSIRATLAEFAREAVRGWRSTALRTSQL